MTETETSSTMNELENDESELELSNEQLKPTALKPGSRIGLISPASRVSEPSALRRSSNIIEELGYVPVIGKSTLSYEGFTAGSDQARIDDLQTFLADASIEAIVCVSGGYGAARLLPLLDFAQIRKSPKIIIGSGDNDALLSAINQLTGLVIFHGPNLEDVADKYTYEALKNTLAGSKENLTVNCRDSNDQVFESNMYSLSDLSCQGTLCGGNLTALSSLFGTKYKPDFSKKILALDDFAERNSILDRWFTTMYLSGTLSSIAGIAFGGFPSCHARGGNNMLSVQDTFGDRLKELKVPACFGFKFGNESKSNYLPIGTSAELDCKRGSLAFQESPYA
ncbi:MAG: LD-carboxypeptidase [Candidatus Obscuribacterales bacterium]|jgi:muramoyltetrapeptide carboxypeptidase|nr:LD-carboxypeptidase [Candidatus Obscuribacterales bacterium]